MVKNPSIPGAHSEAILACLRISPGRRPEGMFDVHRRRAGVAKPLEEIEPKLEKG